MLLHEMLSGYTSHSRNDEALLYLGKKFSFGTLLSSIDDAAARLAGVVSAGDVVTICMPNTPECVYCFYAVNKLGAIAHMVHPLAPPAQLKKFMAAAKSKLLITLSINLEKYKDIAREYPVIYAHPARSLSPVLRLLFDLKNKPYKGDRTGMTDFDALKKHEPSFPSRDERSTGVYLHSGGTGGEPKIIELSDYAINSLAMHGLEALDKDDAHKTYMLAALPMFHGFGLAMGIHTTLSHGGVSVLMPKFDADLTVKLLKKNKMHYIIGVPNLFRALLKRKGFSGDALKNLYVAFVGGDCAPQDLLDEFNGRMERAGARARLFEGYGLTETVTVCAVNNYAHSKRTSMGYMLSGLKAAVVDGDGAPLPYGERGELVFSGSTVMNGYLDNPEENARAFLTIDGESYVRSGDFGYMDEEGYLYFVQRLKRIIKISGISVYPKEIETVAGSLDGVTGACAVEYKDAGGKTRIALFLTGKPHGKDEIKALIESELSRYAVPTIVEYIDSIPMTPVMKADVRTLEMRAERISEETNI